MKKEEAKLALEFLSRTDLKGGEVPQFSVVISALNNIVKMEEDKKSVNNK